MATITTIASGDLITNSRSDINTNFTNLNSDKIETSVLDTDTTLAANSDSKVATQKAVKSYVDAFIGATAITTASTTTLSLTTTATQKVVVFAKCDVQASSTSGQDILLKYNGVQKDKVVFASASNGSKHGVALMYTETPGAGTQNITVTVSSDWNINNCVIIALKIG